MLIFSVFSHWRLSFAEAVPSSLAMKMSTSPVSLFSNVVPFGGKFGW